MRASDWDQTTVHVHIHSAVAGGFPLRVADVLFTGEAVIVPEYDYVTPLFGIAGSGVTTASEAARDRFRTDGLPGLIESAERVHRVPYETVTSLRLSQSRFTRPKLSVGTAAEPPYAYRIHAPVNLEELDAALRSLGQRRGFAVERHTEVGYDPVASIHRFLAGR
jgi:hypothetical protein